MQREPARLGGTAVIPLLFGFIGRQRLQHLNAWAFYRWRTRLRGERMSRVSARRAVRAASPAPFVDLGEVRSSGSRHELRLELGAGIVLTVLRD